MATAGLKSVTDAHRTDPSKAQRWNVSAAGTWTIVVATCAEEARLLGLLWIAHAKGKTTVDLTTRSRVRPAGDDDSERWLAVRAQQEAGVAGLRRPGT